MAPAWEIAPLLSTRRASANRQEAVGSKAENAVQTIAIGVTDTKYYRSVVRTIQNNVQTTSENQGASSFASPLVLFLPQLITLQNASPPSVVRKKKPIDYLQDDII